MWSNLPYWCINFVGIIIYFFLYRGCMYVCIYVCTQTEEKKNSNSDIHQKICIIWNSSWCLSIHLIQTGSYYVRSLDAPNIHMNNTIKKKDHKMHLKNEKKLRSDSFSIQLTDMLEEEEKISDWWWERFLRVIKIKMMEPGEWMTHGNSDFHLNWRWNNCKRNIERNERKTKEIVVARSKYTIKHLSFFSPLPHQFIFPWFYGLSSFCWLALRKRFGGRCKTARAGHCGGGRHVRQKAWLIELFEDEVNGRGYTYIQYMHMYVYIQRIYI